MWRDTWRFKSNATADWLVYDDRYFYGKKVIGKAVVSSSKLKYIKIMVQLNRP